MFSPTCAGKPAWVVAAEMAERASAGLTDFPIFTIFEPPPPGSGESGSSHVFFFHPEKMMLEQNRMLFVGAVFTFFTFAEKFETGKASSFTTTKHRFACRECEGVYFLLGGPLHEPPSAIQATMDVLFACFRFHYGSIKRVKAQCQGLYLLHVVTVGVGRRHAPVRYRGG